MQETRNSTSHQGTDKLIFGIVLAVVTFWLFAQTTLNVAPAMASDLGVTTNVSNIAVSITALFSGIFIVVAGGLADSFGRVRLTLVGLALNAIGSLLIAASPTGTAVWLIAGRIVQGLSAACIMPATLALMKAYYDGAARQRALSFWSIGSWGGSGLCALFGGLVASTIGWRWIFWMSIAISAASYLLIRGTPESKIKQSNPMPFDWIGLIAFVVAMVALNVLIGQGSALGWLSPAALVLIAVFMVGAVIFFHAETHGDNPFVDLRLLSNRPYSGATLSNFLLNGAAGTLLVALSVVQQGAGLSSLQAGLMTTGYLVAILATIRVGEKLLQRWGPRKPMLLGCAITGLGILLTTFTFLLAKQYIVVAFFGFTLFGIGLGFYATPSTDAALSNVPNDKAGSASGIYKMASSLGAAFGVAISAAIFTALSHREGLSPMADIALGRTDNLALRYAAAIALLFNVLMVVIAMIAIMWTISKGNLKASGAPADSTR
ncbi:MFS transporter [Paraburkholderia aromaticivorans]|uniref:MFS transporter n=1 Tax=Paraburkholderia aromaticivorans TaxID=2026199 RepID=UPI0014562462|nr:MFS transporter [Paraburkholderia aromaticivorans]